MAHRAEDDDRVDLDEDNYSEMDDEAEEEQADESGDDDQGDPNTGEHCLDDYEEVKTEAQEDGEEQEDYQDQSPEGGRSLDVTELAEDEEKHDSPINEEEKEKYSHLLSLPPHGSEVFIGGLPKDADEEDLRDLCGTTGGEIIEVRLIKDRDSGESKGYAFVSFKSKEEAQKAVEELHSKEFKGRTIRCSLSETKNRLFIGNVPKSWTEDEFREVVEGVGPGVESIELIKDPQNSTRNRGFAFVLYYNNACADYSRQKMTNASFKLEGNTPTVTWADPKSSPDQSAAAAQVKALYVKNIPENTSTEQLKELFQRHGEVIKVVMPLGKGGKRDFGFVYYSERSSALKAIQETEKYEINGQELEVVLAKPQAERKPDTSYVYGAGTHAPPPNVHHGFGGGFAGAASLNQPMIYGRGPVQTGMQMVPMVLPDGRIGYVLQQPGMQMAPPPPRAGQVDRSYSSGRGRGRSGNNDGDRGRRYRPY